MNGPTHATSGLAVGLWTSAVAPVTEWPGVPNHGDVTAVNWADVEPVDVITGGTPAGVTVANEWVTTEQPSDVQDTVARES